MGYSVESGKSAFTKVYGMPPFEWMNSQPEEAALFGETMIGFHGAEPPAVAEAYDFSGFGTVVGVEPEKSIENTQLIDSGNARIGMISKIATSTVRSLYGHFPECLQIPLSTFGRPFWRKEHSEVRL